MFGSELRCKKCNQYYPDRCTCHKWQSVAKWPYPQVRLGNSDNTSTDTHNSKEEALEVIALLKKDGFGGNRNIFPVDVYVQQLPIT